jgi:hypothetical protein
MSGKLRSSADRGERMRRLILAVAPAIERPLRAGSRQVGNDPKLSTWEKDLCPNTSWNAYGFSAGELPNRRAS